MKKRQSSMRHAKHFAKWCGAILFFSLAVANLQAADLRTATGIIEPLKDAPLLAAVPGIIMARQFKEGDYVKEGDAIIDLDKQLEALEVDRRKLVLEARKSDYEGTAKLFKNTKGISKEELDKKESDYKLAIVEHAMAEEQLRRRVVRAPFSGTIVNLPLQKGEACQPYQSLGRLVDIRQCYLEVDLEPQTAASLKVKQEVKLELEIGGGWDVITGTIDNLSVVADRASGLVRTKVLFDNPTGKIRPGLSGRLKLQ